MKKTWRKAIRRLYQAHTERLAARWPTEYRRLTPVEIREVVRLAVNELDARDAMTAPPRCLTVRPVSEDQVYCHAMGAYFQ